MITNVQGDVIFKRIQENELPSGDRKSPPQDLKEGILAYGEVTGYRHQLIDQTAFDAFIIMNRVFLRVTREVKLKHGQGRSLDKSVDHQSQVILPGLYEVDGALETDWLTRTVRRVVD